MTPEEDDETRREEKSGRKTVVNVLLVDILLRTGLRLGRRQVEKGLLRRNFSRQQAHRIISGRPISKSLISIVASRVATRSVPGAMLVGGGILAKLLIDARKSAKRKVNSGENEIADQADKV